MHAEVSVVVACFNLGRYLDEAVSSVLSQTFQDFEIVVVDDGSTDAETKTLLAGYERPKVRVLGIEHRGPGAARNLGIRESAGTYVCALDADDIFLPTWLEKGVRTLRQDPGLAFVSCWAEAFGEERWIARPQACDLSQLIEANTLHCSTLVRREVLEAVGGFDEALGADFEDWDLWLRVAQRWRGSILPEVLFRYRRRSGSMSQTAGGAPFASHPQQRLVAKHAALYEARLSDLVLRHEAAGAELRRLIWDGEIACETWLAGGLEAAHGHLVWLRKQVDLVERVEALRAGHAALEGAVLDLQTQLTDQGRILSTVLRAAQEMRPSADGGGEETSHPVSDAKAALGTGGRPALPRWAWLLEWCGDLLRRLRRGLRQARGER